MPVIARIPTTLRPLTGGAQEIDLANATIIGDAIAELGRRPAGRRGRLLDDKGGRNQPSVVPANAGGR